MDILPINDVLSRQYHLAKSLSSYMSKQINMSSYFALIDMIHNSTLNDSSYDVASDDRMEEPSLEDLFEGEQPQLTAMVLHQAATIFVTLFGNLLMIFTILRHNEIKKRRKITPVQFLMLHMCCSDLLYALITIFPTMLITITVPVFHGPNWLCKVVKVLQVVPMYSSSFLLVAISADRFYAICRPLAAMRSTSRYSRPLKYASTAWILAVLFATPQLSLFSKNDYRDCVVEYSQPWQYPVYVIYFNVIVWLLPSVIAGILYYNVCRAVWRSLAYDKTCSSSSSCHTFNTRPMSPLTVMRPKKVSVNNSSSCPLSKQAPNTTENKRLSAPGVASTYHRLQNEKQAKPAGAKTEFDKKRLATVKLTLTIVAANFILWAPFCIISVIDSLMPYFLSPVIATYIMFFGNLNSCVNPWIWFLFNRKTLKTVLKDASVQIRGKAGQEKLAHNHYSAVEMHSLTRASESY